jgi:hypothetical protein
MSLLFFRLRNQLMTRPDNQPPPPLAGDINFEINTAGFEIWYSDRLATDYPELVDQSADYLEDELGLVNLGQVDHRYLIADGPLTDEVKNSLIAWWSERVEDQDLG